MTTSAQVSVRRTRADLTTIVATALAQIIFFTREHGFAIIAAGANTVLVDSAKDAYSAAMANAASPLVITPTMGSATSFPDVAESLAALGYAAYSKWEEFRVTETLLPDPANPGKYVKTRITPPPAFTLYLQEFCDRMSPYQRYLAQYPDGTIDSFMESDEGHKSVAVWFQQDVTHAYVPDEYREFLSDGAYGPDVDAPIGDTRRIKNIEKVAMKADTVPATRKLNGRPLSADISLGAADVGAVPVGRKVNGRALSGDIALTAADVGAMPAGATLADKVNGFAQFSFNHTTSWLDAWNYTLWTDSGAVQVALNLPLFNAGVSTGSNGRTNYIFSSYNPAPTTGPETNYYLFDVHVEIEQNPTDAGWSAGQVFNSQVGICLMDGAGGRKGELVLPHQFKQGATGATSFDFQVMVRPADLPMFQSSRVLQLGYYVNTLGQRPPGWNSIGMKFRKVSIKQARLL